jgi:hypothetical protein
VFNTAAQGAVICVFTDVCLIEDSYIRVGVVATISKLADSIEVDNLKGWEAGDVVLCFFHWSIDQALEGGGQCSNGSSMDGNRFFVGADEERELLRMQYTDDVR